MKVLMMKNVSARIKSRREKIGLTATEAARRTGVSQPAWSKWELGKSEPRGINRLKVAEVLDCNPEWLRTGEGQEEPLKLLPNKAKEAEPSTDGAPGEVDLALMGRVKDAVFRAIKNSKKTFTYEQKVTLVAKVYRICAAQGLASPLDLDDQEISQLLKGAS